MGLMFTKLWSIIFGGSDVKIIIVGLNAAGKTTILYRLYVAVHLVFQGARYKQCYGMK
jgi:ABC-type molybdenum transport system ATPase subunit/photorepair protein PhrA